MPLTPRKLPPLRELKPEKVALLATHALINDALGKLSAVDERAVEGASEQLAVWVGDSPFFQRVKTLVDYAQGGPMPAGLTLSKLLVGVAPLYRSAREPGALPSDREPQQPVTLLGLAIAGALARERLEKRVPLSCVDLSVLIGRDKDRITALAAEGKIPGSYRDETLNRSPWRFRATKELREWIDNR